MSMCCTAFDSPEFQSTIWRAARKEHKCCECRAVILPEDFYQLITGKWDGYIESFKTCEKCADLRDSLSQIWCIPLKELKDEYKNYLDEIGVVEYDDALEEYIYPENHLNLNDA